MLVYRLCMSVIRTHICTQIYFIFRKNKTKIHAELLTKNWCRFAVWLHIYRRIFTHARRFVDASHSLLCPVKCLNENECVFVVDDLHIFPSTTSVPNRVWRNFSQQHTKNSNWISVVVCARWSADHRIRCDCCLLHDDNLFRKPFVECTECANGTSCCIHD